MAQISVTVNGRTFKMGCKEGQERRVVELAEEIDAHVQHIKGDTRLVPDDRLFLMAALILADQLRDAREELQNSLKQIADFRAFQTRDGRGGKEGQRAAS